MADTSWRTWEVKNGVYGTDDSGAVTHWVLVANTHEGAEWIVLGMYCTEDDIYSDYNYNSALEITGITKRTFTVSNVADSPWDNWACFLQDEAVRLAEEKGLVPDDTALLICRQEGFSGSQIQGGDEPHRCGGAGQYG